MSDTKTTQDAKDLARVRQMTKTGAALAIRRAEDLSLADVAAPVQVDRTTIWRWEHGKRRPTGEAAIRYLRLLDELSGVGSLLLFLVLSFAAVFDPDRWYTPTEIWRGSHGARAQVYEALDRGELRGLRRGRRWLVPGQAVKDWIGGDRMADNGAGNGSSPPTDAGSRG